MSYIYLRDLYDKNNNSFRLISEIFNIKDKLALDKLNEEFAKNIS